MKIAIITCYFEPDYVRSRSLRAALEQVPDVETIVIKNKHRGILRYPEVVGKLIACRLRQRPDVYLLGFRGQEMLPITLALTAGKPLIFDEFIVPLAWANQEGHRPTARTRLFVLLARLSAPFYKAWLRHCAVILTDTASHAKLSQQFSGVAASKYVSIPVSTDETLFKPSASKPAKPAVPFTVFYYGLKMTNQQGLAYILEAANIIAEQNLPIKFIIAGGDAVTATAIAEAQADGGAQIDYHVRIPFEEFQTYIYQAGLCLGGPFGDTPQAQRVIAGKTYQFLACGAPTVIGENDETSQFKSGYDSLLVPRGDGQALANTIIWGYEHRDQLGQIGARGRTLYEDKFSNQVVGQILAPVLKQLAGRPKKS